MPRFQLMKAVERYKIALMLGFAFLARLIFLGLRPLDGDEGVVIKIANSTKLSDLWVNVAKDVHPPLYHLLQFTFQKILPDGEFYLRLLPAILGVVTIYFIYLVFKRLVNEKTALVVALLSILSPVLSYHSAEVRPYPLLALLFFASIYFLTKSLQDNKIYDWVWTGLISLLLILTQYIGFIIILAELAYLVIYKRKHLLKFTITSALSFLAFFIVWGGQFTDQVLGRVSEQSQALSIKENLIGLVNFFYRLGAGRLFLDINPSPARQIEFMKFSPVLYIVFLLSLLVPLTLFIIGLKNQLKDNKSPKIIYIVSAVLLTIALLSSEIGPKAVRYYIFLAPIYIYIIISALQFSGKIYKVLFGLFVVIYATAFINGFYFERVKPGVDVIAQHISKNAEAGDKALVKGGFAGGESFVLKYYLEDSDKYQIVDFFGNYEAGNLSKLMDKSVVDFIKENQDGSPIWFYDMSYTEEGPEELDPIDKIELGKDKEGQELVLYRF